ncbi:ABC transporter permease subunit [bacterium]|nr:ABC transporter permease subunit [bacterium]
MLKYIQKRLLISIPTIVGISFIVFAIIYMLPGDAIDAKLAEYAASAEDIQKLKDELGMNEPWYVQYGTFLAGAVRGDLGRSVFTRQPVMSQIMQQVPATLQLAFASIAISIVIGVTLGSIAAIKQNTWIDTLIMILAMFGLSMPTFWLALIAIYVFSLHLGWFPVAGSSTWRHLVLPATILGIEGAGVLARMTRSSMLEVLRQDYIITARAKGLQEIWVLASHALRNALLPVVTIIGFQLGYAIGGAVIIETIFGRQGVGQLAVSAILQHDIPLVQGIVLMVATTLVLANLFVDLCYGILDPRIRYT